MNIIIVKVLCKIDNIVYRLLSKYAIRAEGNGLHPKHRLMNYHGFFIDNITQDDRILDIGCGNGSLTLDISEHAGDVTGIDINPVYIKSANQQRLKKSAKNVTFKCQDIVGNDFNESFDKIILSNVLEHIENRIILLKRIREIAPIILLRVPMVDRSWVTLYKRELGIDYKLDPGHYIEYTQKSLEAELREAGWRIGSQQRKFGETWAVCIRD